MLTIQKIEVAGYEEVVEAKDPEVGLHCFIAIHSTALGPSLGGTRIFPYATCEAALQDALRLSKAMTYKAAIARVGLGGGKGVIIANSKTQKTEPLLTAYAKVIDSLNGRYITAEDVGTNPNDMRLLRKTTPYVAALPSSYTSSGDPSRFTAWGVLEGMRAVSQMLFHTRSLKHKKVAIVGLGNVGSKLANFLFWEGADLLVSDLDPEQTCRIAYLYGAKALSPQEIVTAPCDILSPCAMGGIITPEISSQLNCRAIAGSANNQLSDSNVARLLFDKGILFAPDYIINAGGLINASCEFDKEGYNARRARDKIQIYETLIALFKRSEKEKKPPQQIADQMAEHLLAHLVGKREHPIDFHA